MSCYSTKYVYAIIYPSLFSFWKPKIVASYGIPRTKDFIYKEHELKSIEFKIELN